MIKDLVKVVSKEKPNIL